VLFAARSPGTHARRRGGARGHTDRARARDPPAIGRLGERLTSGIQAAIDETGVPVQVRESAGVWTVYFTDQPIRRFRDFARFAMDKNHPVQRAYRGWLLERGIYVHPHYMIRGFLTGAHTDDDVDRWSRRPRASCGAPRGLGGLTTPGRGGRRSGAGEDRRHEAGRLLDRRPGGRLASSFSIDSTSS
jgi:hypothetical protein